MIVPKVLCGGADSGSAGGAQRCEPGEVKFHPLGEAQQDIPSYPLSRRCSFRRKGKHVDGFLAWEASNDRKLQLFTMKRKTLEILLEWKPQGLGSQEVRHLKREHPEQMHYIISELEVGIGAVCIAFDSEQLGVAWFVYSCTILYAMGTLPLTLQLTRSYHYLVLCDQVSATKEKQMMFIFIYIYGPHPCWWCIDSSTILQALQFAPAPLRGKIPAAAEELWTRSSRGAMVQLWRWVLACSFVGCGNSQLQQRFKSLAPKKQSHRIGVWCILTKICVGVLPVQAEEENLAAKTAIRTQHKELESWYPGTIRVVLWVDTTSQAMLLKH